MVYLSDHPAVENCAQCGRVLRCHEFTRRAPATGRYLCATCDAAVTTLLSEEARIRRILGPLRTSHAFESRGVVQ